MKIAIFGSSGHARDIADIAIDNGYKNIVFLTADDGLNSFCGHPVEMDTNDTVARLKGEGYHFAIGIGSCNIRRRIAERYPTLEYPSMRHSSVTLGNCQAPNLNQMQGTIISAGSRITNNVTLGDFCFLGVNTIVGHDCIVENFSSLMPATAISGNVHIKQNAYIGCNASIRQGTADDKLIIGEGAVIGMGAVVLGNVPDGHTALGVPAKFKATT